MVWPSTSRTGPTASTRRRITPLASRGGITFTFGGLKINTSSEVVDTAGHVIPGLYAAGELVGGLYYHNYASGSGLTSGAVFGRISGRSAADFVAAQR